MTRHSCRRGGPTVTSPLSEDLASWLVQIFNEAFAHCRGEYHVEIYFDPSVLVQ